MSFLRTSRLLTICFLLLISSISARHTFAQPISFDEFLQERFSSAAGGWNRERFCPVSTSVVARRVLGAYGAMFAAHESVVLPPTCIHRGESDVVRYQKKLVTKRVDVGGIALDFQSAAAESLTRSIAEAAEKGLQISPYDGAIAGGRSYGQTLMLWNSRFFPALDFWIEQGRLSEADRDEIARLDLDKRIEKVFEWESSGIYFSTNRSRSILTSTAPPGSSQHLAFLALDIAEYSNPEVRGILQRNGWFQTVLDDPPHFTYLGVAETDLPSRGLRAIYKGDQLYWVPNIPTSASAKFTN